MQIRNLDEFVETFLYFFVQGSNAEFVSLEKDLFFLFHDRLYDTVKSNGESIRVKDQIGGHASVWAIRA